MPIYMDRHDIPGATAKDVAMAHQADLKVQDEYGCRGLTYWFDGERGIAFCLVEAPKKEAVEAMHNRAHGLIPHQIIEVDANLVESFLGRIEDANHSDNYSNETATRILLATDLKDSALMDIRYGNKKMVELFNKHNVIIRAQIENHKGNEVKSGGNGILAAFSSVNEAIHCAIDIREEFRQHNAMFPEEVLHVTMGLNAGLPLSNHYGFFEQVVRIVRRMCVLADPDQIMVSPEAFELVMREDISILNDRSHIRILSPKEENFLNKLMDTFERFLSESRFGVPDLCRETGMSKSQLNRKIHSLTGYSPNELIKEFRLKKALDLLDKKMGNISEIAFEAGFSSPSYFSKCFQKRFEVLPSDIYSQSP